MSFGIYGPVTALEIAATNPSGPRYNFEECTIGLTEELKDMNAAAGRGTLSHSKEQTRPNLRRVAGQFKMTPTALELSTLLPFLLGTAVSGTTYALANAPLTRYISVVKDNSQFGGTDGEVFVYNGCAVDTWSMKASKGSALEVSFTVVGLDETPGAAGSRTPAALDITTSPLMFRDTSITVAGGAVTPFDFELNCDYKLDKERFLNSPTLTQTNWTDREMTFKTNLPWSANEAIYNSGSAGVAIVNTLTHGVDILTLTMAAVLFPRITPPINGRDELKLPIQGMVQKSGATLELVTTLALS